MSGNDEELESLAREGGWIPEGEWDASKPAPSGGFKSAEEFLDDSPRILMSERKRNARLEKQIEKLNSKLDQQAQDAQAVTALVQQNYERERREKERLMTQLERERQVAISEGDSEAAIAADRELSRLKTEPAAGADPNEQQQVVAQWIARNQWYESDPELRDIAAGIAARLRQEGVTPGQPLLAAVESEVRGRYPDRVSSEQVLGGKPGNPEGEARPVRRTNGRTFDDLPNEAQNAYHRFKKLNPALTKPQYLAEYEWEDA